MDKLLPEFSLKIHNRAVGQPDNKDFCLFQKPSEDFLYSPAWKAERCLIGNDIVFRWNKNYSFGGRKPGNLKEGVLLDSNQILDCDPGNPAMNAARLIPCEGSYRLSMIEENVKKTVC